MSTWAVGAVVLALSWSLVRADDEARVLVRHAPTLNGRVEGSVQMMTAEGATLNGSAVVTGDLFVPGTPTVRLNGSPAYGGTVDGTGTAAPSSYYVTLNGNASLRHVVRRTDPVTLPVVDPPPAPTGTRNVSLNQPGQSPGDFATLRNLTLNGNAGSVAVPPGTYGSFTANSGSGFILGVAGATTPSLYNFQNLTFNSGSSLQVVGPVIVTVDGGFSINANSGLGAAANPEWLDLRVAGGGLTVNSHSTVYAHLVASAGSVTLNGGSQFVGTLVSDRLIINGNSLLRVSAAAPNQPPAVSLSAPADGAVFFAPASVTLVATASDSDGTIAKVEFFQGTTKLGEATAAPYAFSWTGVPEGSYTLTAVATDDAGATTTSAPVGITVATPVNQPPTVTLLAPADGATFTSPAAIHLEATASDPDGTIAKVEFFHGASKLGEVAGPPFVFDWLNVAPGGYALTATATDNAGATATSVPRTISVATGMPFAADFEFLEGYVLGSLDGQGGWTANGASLVTNADAQHGEQSVLVPGLDPPVSVGHAFPDSISGAVVFVDFYALPAAGVDPASASRYEINGARLAIVRSGSEGVLQIFDGDGSGGGAWEPTGGRFAVEADGFAADWHRLTLRADYAAKTWDLYLDGAIVAVDGGFLDNTPTLFSSFSLTGHPATATLFDHFGAGFDNPLFADADKDGMHDAWESAHGLDPAVNDRAGDLDGDGLSNVREWLLGTRPDLADTDGDGMPDGWEVQHGTDPKVDDAAADADQDGLTNLQEYQAGTNPQSADTDGDGMPDAWELAHGLDPRSNDAAADPDQDGFTNLQEFAAGTDPHDYYNGAAPAVSWVGISAQVRRPGNPVVLPLAVAILDAPNGNPRFNAPITFKVDALKGTLLASSEDSTGAGELTVLADATGVARVWLRLNTDWSGRVTATAQVYVGGAPGETLSFDVFPLVESAELAVGADQSLWLDDGGIARAWGRNAQGQLGDGTTVDRSQMQRLASVTTPLKSAAFGQGHGLAVTDTGAVLAWGDNYFGQLGDGGAISHRVPGAVPGLSGVVQVAAGDHHSLALRADGTVWAWGGNQSGQLGDGTRQNRTAPVQVPGLTGIIRIAAGARHSVALDADGAVWAWGSNEFGQLADAALADRPTPAAIPGVANVVTLVSGRQQILALCVDGTVWGWGGNHEGQLGLGIVHGQVTPQRVLPLPLVVGLAAGNHHSVALGSDGVLQIWGANDVGQLGNGESAPSLSPVPLLLADVRAFAAGWDHVVVLKTDGSLQAWGFNRHGQLGAQTAGSFSNAPVTVAPPVD
ncbi:MAG: Ig-like domain-containing protein [Opitutaceae bacterium]|nr:Ig-like domain-containing protein [Opitutaceae bacterium]